MAIFHLNAKVISRGKGQSAIAAAAYRSGERLRDEETAEQKFYKARAERIEFTDIMAPKDAPEWVHDRNELWNHAERAEKRKDAQLAREIEVSLPHELNGQQREWLIKDFAREAFVRKGYAVDIAIHAPDGNADHRNYHAHLMVSMRRIGPEGFTGDKDRSLNSKAQLGEWREQWANIANRHLERHGHSERIDHRSFEDRGMVTEPGVHLGHAAAEMMARGAQSDRFDSLRATIYRNQNRYDILKQLGQTESELSALQAEFKKTEQQPKPAPFAMPAEFANLDKMAAELMSSILKGENKPTPEPSKAKEPEPVKAREKPEAAKPEPAPIVQPIKPASVDRVLAEAQAKQAQEERAARYAQKAAAFKEEFWRGMPGGIRAAPVKDASLNRTAPQGSFRVSQEEKKPPAPVPSPLPVPPTQSPKRGSSRGLQVADMASGMVMSLGSFVLDFLTGSSAPPPAQEKPFDMRAFLRDPAARKEHHLAQNTAAEQAKQADQALERIGEDMKAGKALSASDVRHLTHEHHLQIKTFGDDGMRQIVEEAQKRAEQYWRDPGRERE